MYVLYVNKNKVHTYVFYVKRMHFMDIGHKTHMYALVEYT